MTVPMGRLMPYPNLRHNIFFLATWNIAIEQTDFRILTPPFSMALRELPWSLGRLTTRCPRRVASATVICSRRFASSQASYSQEVSPDVQELESQSSFSTTDYSTEKIEAYDPVKRAQGRKRELPPSRYAANASRSPDLCCAY
jgi:hypothetical protein